jgi:hypothetical protein
MLHAVAMANDWYEKLRCPKCGRTGMATLSQDEGHMPTVEVVPEGFKLVITSRGPDFHCKTCKVAAYP